MNDFKIEIHLFHNGTEYAISVDMSPYCVDGILPKSEFDLSMRKLRNSVQGRLYDLKVLPWPPEKE